LLAVPVVDMEEYLVGIITVDDAMDILEEESTEDMYIQAGLATIKNNEHDRSRTLIEGSLWEILKVRIPILILVLAGGFLAGMIVEGFEEVLASITAVAFFMPLIMDMGGSIGGQSTTIFARGVVLGHIKMDRFLKHLGKEALVGVSIGILVGIMAYLAAWLWLGDPLIGLAVGLALVASCLVAAVCGFLVPFVLVKIGADQAAGSGPIITSIKDISGLLIYFWLVSTLLTHLM
jgi:magnesium transporter